MERRLSKIYPQKWAQVAILIGFCLILFFFNLNRWDLWNPDEPRYAQVAREMVDGGDWILMHYNGKVYGDKPPLFFWLIALSSYLWQGFTSFAVRFPSALFGTLTILVTFLLGKTLYSARTGFLSGLILATSLEFAYLSTRANIDTTLTFFTTTSLFCFFKWYREVQDKRKNKDEVEVEVEVEGKDRNKVEVEVEAEDKGKDKTKFKEEDKRNNLYIYGFYVSMALATLAKGPVGFILPLLVSLIYLLVRKDWNGFKAMRLLPGMVLFLALVCSWYLPAVLKGGQNYLEETLLTHSIIRFVEGKKIVKPFYYYFYDFPTEFLPWIFFLPTGLAYGFSKGMVNKKKEFLFLLFWFIVIFFFFFFSKGKRGIYLLPLYPAASIMVGKLWDDFISSSMEHFRNEWISVPFYLFMGLALLAGTGLPWAVSMKFPSHLPYSLPLAFLFVGGSLAMFVLLRFKYYGAIFFLLAGIAAGGFFYTLRVVFPLVNPYKSARFISQEITSRIQPGEKVGLYGGFVTGPYNFYTGIVPIEEMNKKEELFDFLRSSGRVFCIFKFRDFSQFQTWEGKPKVELIARRKVGGDDIVVISNK
jgi:4-amino-4-deoxy-L-arabinose transferase-like glycosyltransferase